MAGRDGFVDEATVAQTKGLDGVSGFAFAEEVADGAEEAGEFAGQQGGEKDAEDARVVVAKEFGGAVFHGDAEMAAELETEGTHGLIGKDKDAEVMTPAAIEQPAEEGRAGFEANEVRGDDFDAGFELTAVEADVFRLESVEMVEEVLHGGAVDNGIGGQAGLGKQEIREELSHGYGLRVGLFRHTGEGVSPFKGRRRRRRIGQPGRGSERPDSTAVSYTHLTLPTT
jgi:hypothetical protein